MPASLLKPYQRFVKETALLSQVVSASTHLSNSNNYHSSQGKFAIDMCVMRLHDAWARFCREVVVFSAYAEPLTANGTKLPRVPGITKRSQVIPFLISTYRKRTQEPSWYLAQDCIDAARRLQIANYSAISGGIGLSFPNLHSPPNDQLRVLRNFLAHRNPDTAKEANQIGQSFNISRVENPSSLITLVIPPGITIFAFWINSLRLMASLSIQ